tara:strand:- start:139 stop:615 length:477 start_codon:yes stop_codon:yes gene_type:complete
MKGAIMLSNFSYPVICTRNYAQTVNFYEDHFGFAPEFEMPDFSILKRSDSENDYIAIIDENHEVIPKQYHRSIKGMILHFPVKDVNVAYQQFYWEGLNIITEPGQSPNIGLKHFFVEDPNGILISVAEALDTAKFDELFLHDLASNKRKKRKTCAGCV